MISSDYIPFTDLRDLVTKHKRNNDNFLTNTIISLNIANVNSKLSDLKLFLLEISTPENKIDIIALSETHITEGKTAITGNDLKYLISGYTFINVGRKTKQGGGVGCFISNDIIDQVEKCPNESQEEVFKSLFLRIKAKITRDAKRYSKDGVLGILYRQPNNANQNAFLSEF
jgi:exonuclease III